MKKPSKHSRARSVHQPGNRGDCDWPGVSYPRRVLDDADRRELNDKSTARLKAEHDLKV